MKAVKNRMKMIVNISRNRDNLTGNNFEFAKFVLSYHDDKERLKDLKNIMIDIHPKYQTSRCFFIVKEDGSEHDISYHKCLSNLYKDFKAKSEN